MKNETALGQECSCIPPLEKVKSAALVALGREAERREMSGGKRVREWQGGKEVLSLEMEHHTFEKKELSMKGIWKSLCTACRVSWR